MDLDTELETLINRLQNLSSQYDEPDDGRDLRVDNSALSIDLADQLEGLEELARRVLFKQPYQLDRYAASELGSVGLRVVTGEPCKQGLYSIFIMTKMGMLLVHSPR